MSALRSNRRRWAPPAERTARGKLAAGAARGVGAEPAAEAEPAAGAETTPRGELPAGAELAARAEPATRAELAVRIRPVLPGDAPFVKAIFEGMGDDSRYRRFHGPKPRLTSAELRYLAEVDGWNHFAMLAFAADGSPV